jgi:hypothetical protein
MTSPPNLVIHPGVIPTLSGLGYVQISPDQSPPIINTGDMPRQLPPVVATSGPPAWASPMLVSSAPTSNPNIPTGQDLVAADQAASKPPTFIDTFFQGPHIILLVAAGLGLYLLMMRKKGG